MAHYNNKLRALLNKVIKFRSPYNEGTSRKAEKQVAFKEELNSIFTIILLLSMNGTDGVVSLYVNNKYGIYST
jgi:hypothetical protein